MGLKILPPDVNESGRSFSVNKDRVIRFGLAGVKNVGENAIGSILQARKEGPFKSLMDFCKRVDNSCLLYTSASFIGTGFKRYFWRYSLSGTGYADHFRSGRLQPRAGRYSAAGYGQEKG